MGGLWAVILYGIVVLAFGAQPPISPVLPLFIGLSMAVTAIYFLPKWAENPAWQDRHRFSVIFGTITGAMIVGFIGFIDVLPSDLDFKIVLNIIALVLLIWFGFSLKRKAIPILF